MSRVGLIDVGTNTLRLIIGEPGENGVPRFLYHEVLATRLGEGLSQRNELSPEAIERTIDGLRRLKAKANSYGVKLVEAYATAWARLATNTDEVLSSVAKLDLPIWILTEEEEAMMAVESVKLLAIGTENFWVVDMGGGSTQIVRVINGEGEYIRSVPFGAVNFTEKYLLHDPPEVDRTKAEEEVKKLLALQRLGETGEQRARVVALGGTVATLGALKVGIAPEEPSFFEKVQGLSLEQSWIKSEIDVLFHLSLAERKKLAGMEPERADILPGGAILLHGFLSEINASTVFICLYSFIHGLLAKRVEALE